VNEEKNNLNKEEKIQAQATPEKAVQAPNNASNDRRNRFDRRNPREEANDGFDKNVLQVDRISRTVKGGKRIRFRALVILGNRAGKVGIGVGKAAEVVDAVEKGTRIARKNLIDAPIVHETIPHEIEFRLGSAHILLKPARKGTSIVAGGTIRAICDLAGIKNIVGKILGTANKINNSKATIEAFKQLTKEKNA